MTEPRLIPPPPNYPPISSAYRTAAAPRVIVVTPETTTQAQPGLLARLRPVYTGTAIVVSLAPVFGGYSMAAAVGLALHNCRTEQSLPGAWVLAGTALALTAYADHTRRSWIARLLLTTTVIGTLLALPVLDGALLFMTGVTR